MIAFDGSMVLLDVEGTVSPLSYVHDVMFPYARTEARSFVQTHSDHADVLSALNQMAVDAGLSSLAEWCPSPYPSESAFDWVTKEIHALMDADAKVTGLKQLQGLIWKQGFHAGQLRSTLFPDVVKAFDQWSKRGLQLRIYSSGSVQAQKLFFGHSEFGDLSHYLSGYYDTTIGGKRESKSYSSIALDSGVTPSNILFLSDVVEELDAARESGMQTCLVIRPGNRETAEKGHRKCISFEEITFSDVKADVVL